ncbi:glucuronate isomerase [Haematomicrobium sanguinis]|uniref:glucuronate isomerase n=1 Tax=Haematomicrobium sanguinis TaxID=479106 RepID=UPI00047B091D|nr:glucuronate isomerase [Haematomicrobium sanguinis]
MSSLTLDPDRLFPVDAREREVARELYEQVAGAPIISPHGHVDAALLAANEPFEDPASLLLVPDHYVLRLLHAHGVPLDELGRGSDGAAGPASSAGSAGAAADPRAVWRLFCEKWHVFAGTPVRYWFESVFADVFGLTSVPSAETADALYDEIAALLREPEFLPRALFERFNIAVLATTDAPEDSLAAHAALAADESFSGRVLPTFRADKYMDPSLAGWARDVAALGEIAGVSTASYAGLLEALRLRRAYFAAHGATATDTGVVDAWAVPLSDSEAERIHRAGMAGGAGGSGSAGGAVSPEDAAAYRRNMLYQFALMSRDDGLVMQLHPGVLRNHHRPTLERFGPDTGHDLPLLSFYTEPLRAVLEDIGTDPAFRMVLFTVDESVFSRELGPLAGFYPSVFVGAPWWFLDTPSAIRRFREAATDSAGFYKTSGFIDDTRAFCSIPARHDMSRRLDAGFLANLVVTGQLGREEAGVIARDLVDAIPRSVFRL